MLAVRCSRVASNGDRHRRFADPTCTDGGQEAMASKLCRQCDDDIVAADDACERGPASLPSDAPFGGSAAADGYLRVTGATKA